MSQSGTDSMTNCINALLELLFGTKNIKIQPCREEVILVEERDKADEEDGGGEDPADEGPHHADRVGLPVRQEGDVGSREDRDQNSYRDTHGRGGDVEDASEEIVFDEPEGGQV